MPVQPSFPDFKKNHEQIIQNVILSVQEAVQRALMEAVNLAKMTDTYQDRTNNLRSSIGYVLYYNGQMVASHFEAGGQGAEGDGSKGKQEGVEAAKQAAAEAGSSGFVGVLVAGMGYARWVENRGFDVITGSWLQVDDLLKQNFEDIKDATGIDFNRK